MIIKVSTKSFDIRRLEKYSNINIITGWTSFDLGLIVSSCENLWILTYTCKLPTLHFNTIKRIICSKLENPLTHAIDKSKIRFLSNNHIKLYLCLNEKEKPIEAFVGSCNFTNSNMMELLVRVTNKEMLSTFKIMYEELWEFSGSTV